MTNLHKPLIGNKYVCVVCHEVSYDDRNNLNRHIREKHETKNRPAFFKLIKQYAYLKQYEPHNYCLKRSDVQTINIRGTEGGGVNDNLSGCGVGGVVWGVQFRR